MVAIVSKEVLDAYAKQFMPIMLLGCWHAIENDALGGICLSVKKAKLA